MRSPREAFEPRMLYARVHLKTPFAVERKRRCASVAASNISDGPYIVSRSWRSTRLFLVWRKLDVAYFFCDVLNSRLS